MSVSLRVFCFTDLGHLREKACINPIEVACLDLLRPGLEQWAFNAKAKEAVEIQVTGADVEWFNAIRTDDEHRERIARRLAGRCYEVYKVCFYFAEREWDYKSCDVFAAVAWQALGFGPNDVPSRSDEPEKFSAVVVRWVPNEYPPLPLVVPVPMPPDCLYTAF